jgi:hypothetical protein
MKSMGELELLSRRVMDHEALLREMRDQTDISGSVIVAIAEILRALLEKTKVDESEIRASVIRSLPKGSEVAARRFLDIVLEK